MKGVYLLLGSNLGQREKTLQSARQLIEKRCGKIVNTSMIYRSEAWGIENQPDFLNQVVELETDRDATSLLQTILEIEKELGRIRYKKWHERIIDIDILYFGTQIIDAKDLKVPHPENQNRNFVLAPMVEVAPEFIHPRLGISQREMLARSTDPLKVSAL
jgi:2-amino-4-hydroxy-6-hydroxymethyldihydropteridine diphosphokinase